MQVLDGALREGQQMQMIDWARDAVTWLTRYVIELIQKRYRKSSINPRGACLFFGAVKGEFIGRRLISNSS